MKSPLKNLKKYFQLIMTALICFVMGVIEDKKRICIKDTDSKDILLNDEMIKGAKYSYTSDSKGAYQVYEEMNHESRIE